MPTWFPVSGALTQRVLASGVPANGYVLKFYTPTTLTNIPLATDSTGGTQANYAVANSTGDWTVSGNTIIPHINTDYKFCIYPTQAAADADTGAVVTVDNMALATVFVTPATIGFSNTAANIDAAVDAVETIKTSKGALLTSTGATWAALSAGTNNYVLKANSGAANGVEWADPAFVMEMAYETRSSNTILGANDRGKVIEYTSGSFSQTVTAAATLGSDWFIYLKNASTGVVTVDPNSSETIGGASTAALNPGDVWLVTSDGTNLQLVRLQGMNKQIYTSGSGNFTVPAGVERLFVRCVGGGGGALGGPGASDNAGAGGGAYCEGWVDTAPAATIAYAVGAPGTTAPSAGGNTTFGALTANGGAACTGPATVAGGTASGGDVNINGGAGAGDANWYMGGGSVLSPPGPKSSGSGPGGGGACAGSGASAAGKAGIIIVEWV